ncbi:MAG: hypothetical protein ACFN06_02980 [Limosilactobacillus oris]
MALLISTAVLTIAAVFSGILAGVFPRVPSNYLSIAIGIVIAVVAPLDRLIAPFHSEIFMYIIVPLIYFEGQTTRLYFVRRWWRQIIETAVLLVVASLVIAGFAVSLLGIPLAIAFVLAAISTRLMLRRLRPFRRGGLFQSGRRSCCGWNRSLMMLAESFCWKQWCFGFVAAIFSTR